MTTDRKWTRDELILAINLYFKTPFHKITNHNPDIINLANLINRTTSDVFRKLIHFVNLDNTIQTASKSVSMIGDRQDIVIWDEFSENPAKLEYENNKILKQYKKIPSTNWDDFIFKSNLSTKASNILIRNFSSLEELLTFDESKLLELTNFTPRLNDEIIEFIRNLKNYGLNGNPTNTTIFDTSYKKCIVNADNNEERLPAEARDHDWEELIIQSSLSSRTKNVLLNNFASLEEFQTLLKPLDRGQLFNLDRVQLLKLKNCGQKTINEITDFIFDNELWISDLSFTPTLKDLLALPPDDTSLDKLPIFNRTSSEPVSINDLHPNYKPFVLLSDIAFSARTTKIIKEMGLETIGEMMCTPYGLLMKQKNFGRKCLDEVHQAIQQIVFESTEGSFANHQLAGGGREGLIGYSSYETMVGQFIKSTIKNDRDQKVIFDRLCFQNSKIPTLKELGEKHEITRERARQILFKSEKILKIKSNFNKLAHFWDTLERIIRSGGGVIGLDALTASLKEEFNWPQMPSPMALGQLLSLWLPDRKLKKSSALVEIDCECLSCEKPLQAIQSFDFDSNESFHLKVVGKKLLDDCQKNCANPSGPVLTFHDAFIEKVVGSSGSRFIIKDGLLYLYEAWAVKFGKSLEDAIIVILKKYGQPMHYSNIAMELRKVSSNFEEMGDRNVHASLSRYQSVELVGRGTFALKEWGVQRYQSVSDAIEQLLRSSYYPMQRQDIISQLNDDFTEGNISASLFERTTRFIAIGEGFYDCLDRWQKRSCHDFMKDLPDGLHEFMTYLVTNNNCSYKLVLALVFIKGMNDDGTMPISTLKERFYNFFAARQAKGLVVEKDEVLASKINMLDPWEFKNLTLKNPIISFVNSGFFTKNEAVIKLQSNMIPLLNMVQYKNIVIFILLKSINEYFSAIDLPSETENAINLHGIKTSYAANDVTGCDSECSQEYDSGGTTEIAIKKIKRVKIQL